MIDIKLITKKHELLKESRSLIYDFDKVRPEDRPRYEEIQLMLAGIEYLEKG